MILEQGKAYIQRNPLFGRKVLRFDSVRESVWGWDLCDITIVTIDKDPEIVKLNGAASSIYDHQGLIEISVKTYNKILGIVRLLEVAVDALNENDSKFSVMRQVALGKIIEILYEEGVIDEDTYSVEGIRNFAQQYENYSRDQMARVTDVIDVHK